MCFVLCVCVCVRLICKCITWPRRACRRPCLARRLVRCAAICECIHHFGALKSDEATSSHQRERTPAQCRSRGFTLYHAELSATRGKVQQSRVTHAWNAVTVTRSGDGTPASNRQRLRRFVGGCARANQQKSCRTVPERWNCMRGTQSWYVEHILQVASRTHTSNNIHTLQHHVVARF